MRAAVSSCAAAVAALLAAAAEPAKLQPLLAPLQAVKNEGVGSPAARAAWDRIVALGPSALPDLLIAMDTPDTAAANWLRTAFDRIVADARPRDSKAIDRDALRRFAADPRRQGRARRVALDLLTELLRTSQPGFRTDFLSERIDDPEFGHDAIELWLDKLAKSDLPDDARRAKYQALFAASRDIEQARAVAAKLKERGVAVSVSDHLGFFRDWLIVGPFDGNTPKGFATPYPPEKRVDLGAAYPGKAGKTVRWQRAAVPEAASGRPGVVDLFKPLGEPEDAVAYAYTAVESPADQEVEFRAAADDNLQVWVNGQRVFGLEEYRNGLRIDRHRFRAKLQAGKNEVLVKICQGKADGGTADSTFEFVLRACDGSGKGVRLRNALPATRPNR